MYYKAIINYLSVNNIKIKDDIIYIGRNGATKNITCLHSMNIVISSVSSIPSDAVNGVNRT